MIYLLSKLKATDRCIKDGKKSKKMTDLVEMIIVEICCYENRFNVRANLMPSRKTNTRTNCFFFSLISLHTMSRNKAAYGYLTTKQMRI